MTWVQEYLGSVTKLVNCFWSCALQTLVEKFCFLVFHMFLQDFDAKMRKKIHNFGSITNADRHKRACLASTLGSGKNKFSDTKNEEKSVKIWWKQCLRLEPFLILSKSWKWKIISQIVGLVKTETKMVTVRKNDKNCHICSVRLKGLLATYKMWVSVYLGNKIICQQIAFSLSFWWPELVYRFCDRVKKWNQIQNNHSG